jgi:hypothetical protein
LHFFTFNNNASVLASKALSQFESALSPSSSSTSTSSSNNDIEVEQRRTLANVLLSNVLELLRFTSAKLSTSDELWMIIALTHERIARQSAATATSRQAHATRAVDARLKALRAAESASPELFSLAAQFSHVANAALAVAEAYILLASFGDSTSSSSSSSSIAAAANADTTSTASPTPSSSSINSTSNSSLSAIDSIEAISIPPISSSRLKLSTLLKRASTMHSEMREFVELSETLEKLTAIEKQQRN